MSTARWVISKADNCDGSLALFNYDPTPEAEPSACLYGCGGRQQAAPAFLLAAAHPAAHQHYLTARHGHIKQFAYILLKCEKTKEYISLKFAKTKGITL